MSRLNLLDLLPSELEDLAESLGAPRYRGRQIVSWLYGKGVTDIEAMSDLPRDFRATLAERATVGVPQIERRTPSQDGSQKLVLILEDGARIQSVLMPDRDRLTLCVSTQVGCGFACAFCLTGTMGLERNLTAGEIVGQVLAARATLGPGEPLTPLVHMGMGGAAGQLRRDGPVFPDPDRTQGLRLLAPPDHRLDRRARPWNRAPRQGEPQGQPGYLAPRNQQRDPRQDHAGEQGLRY